MTYPIHYFYRHPHPIYFSIEKLFAGISRQIRQEHAGEFAVQDVVLPYNTGASTLLKNLRFAKRRQGMINHVTGDVHYALLACSKRNINVLTVHDCVLLHQYPAGTLRHSLLKWILYVLPVRKADVVTVISGKTKEELIRFTKCDPDKIRVIPNFVEAVFQPSPYIFNPQLPKILFVGSTPNKNLQRLAEAVTGLDVHLDIVAILTEEQRAMLNERGIRYTVASGLSPEALLEKYHSCDLLAFPSTYEGFGLPIVEAQAVGRPVLTSSLSPMKEVAGEGALLVDPYDVASIRAGILEIIQKDGVRNKLIAAGLSNVNRFRVENITAQYVDLYKELIRRKAL